MSAADTARLMGLKKQRDQMDREREELNSKIQKIEEELLRKEKLDKDLEKLQDDIGRSDETPLNLVRQVAQMGLDAKE